MGLLGITDALINRVNDNWRKGKRAHVFIDEYMSFLKMKKVQPSLLLHGDSSENVMPIQLVLPRMLSIYYLLNKEQVCYQTVSLLSC